MAKWPQVGYDGVTRTDGPAGFHAFGSIYFHDTVEANAQQEVRDTYTASNLRAYITAFVGDPGADDVILTFRVNGGDGNQVLTINGTGEFEDTINTDSLVSGDLICMESDDSAQGHGDSWTTRTFQVTLDASSDVPILMAGLWNTGGPIRYAALVGFAGNRNVESELEYTMRASRTLRDFRVVAESHTSDTVLKVRKNRADGNLTVTVTGTGEFLDTSNTDSFITGDEGDYQTGTNLIRLGAISVEADTSSSVLMWLTAGAGSSLAFFNPLAVTTTTTEAEAQIEAEDTATIQNLFVNCFLYVETRTIRTRKNAANGSVSVSVNGTGLFEDLVNTDSLEAEDDLSIQQDAGSSGFNGYLIAVEWETAVGPPPTGVPVHMDYYRRRRV